MVDTYRNLKFILDTLAPLRIKNPLLSDTWNLLRNVRQYRANPENRSDEEHKAILALDPFYSEKIGDLTRILSQHYPQLVAGLQEASEKIDQQWSLTLQQALAENASRSTHDEAWTTQYSALKEAYADYQKQVNQASKPSKTSSLDPKARAFELALDRYTFVSGHSPIIQRMEAAKQELEPMIEFESRLRPLKEMYRVPFEGMLEEVNELIAHEPSASHHHYHRNPMGSRATSYAMLKEQLEYLLDDVETSPLNVSPKWNSVRARGIDETLKTFNDEMTHHFATLSEDKKALEALHRAKESVVTEPPVPEIEMANEREVRLFVQEGQKLLKKMGKSWLEYDRKDELKNLIEEQLSKIKTPMPAEDFQKLKTEYRVAHDSVVTEWNQALKDYYKQINSLHQTVLEKMESSIQLVDTNATLETFKETFKKDHEHSQNDLGRNETLDEQKLIYREKALKIRLGEMSVAQQGFVKDYRIAAEKKFMKNRLDDPVYQKVIKLIESFTALYNTASTPPAEKKFILDTVRRLDALATSHRLNENRKPKKESELHTEFSRKIGVAVDQRIVQLKKLEPESTPTPARKSAKALLMKASAVMKRLRKKQPAQTHILPQAEAAFREFKDQVKTTPSVSPTPTKTGS